MEGLPERLSSLQNPRVKNLVRLREGSHRRRQRIFLIEGQREISRALQAGRKLDELYFCEEHFRNESTASLLVEAEGAGLHLVPTTREVFAKASGRDHPDGLLATAPMWETALPSLETAPPRLVLLVEGAEKPGNLGTVIRTAEGAGVDLLIVTDPVSDLFGPQVIRNSQGALFSLPCAVASNEDAHAWLELAQLPLVATTPAAEKTLWEVDLRPPVALLMGSEKEGLSPYWLEQPNLTQARIPMAGQADSLNLAAATAIFTYEAVRQGAG